MIILQFERSCREAQRQYSGGAELTLVKRDGGHAAGVKQKDV